MLIIVDNTTGKRKRFLPKLLEYVQLKGVPYTLADDMTKLLKAFDEHKHHLKGFILTGSAFHIINMKEKYIHMNTFAIESGFPVFGTCFGAQFIQVYFGGSLKKLEKTFCKRKIVYYKGTAQEIFDRMPKSFEAEFCLNFIIKELPDVLQASCTTIVDHNQAIVGFQHKKHVYSSK